MDSRNKKIVITVVSVLASLALVCAAFFAGYFLRGCAFVNQSATYNWALSLIDKYYVGDMREEGTVELDVSAYTKEQLALKALAAKLDDYSAYYTAEEYEKIKSDNSGSKSGIGFSYRTGSREGILVSSVIGNSPAYISGMRDGDVLVSGTADGATVQFVTDDTQTAAERLSEFIGARADGEEFLLNTADKSFTVSKQQYIASYASLHTNDTAWGFETSGDGKGLSAYEDKREAISFLPENTAYLKLSQFYGTAAGETGYLLEKFNAMNCTSLILDLRGNGGGFVSVMCDIAGYFVPSAGGRTNGAMVAKFKDGSRSVSYCYDHTSTPASLLPEGTQVYVLANSETASASEALIGVLVSYGVTDYKNIFLSDYSQDYAERWEITKTACSYGKGIMQTTYEMFGTGEAFKLTTAKIYWPNEKCIHGVGLTAADGCKVVPDVEAVSARNDTELKKVINMISAT